MSQQAGQDPSGTTRRRHRRRGGAPGPLGGLQEAVDEPGAIGWPAGDMLGPWADEEGPEQELHETGLVGWGQETLPGTQRMPYHRQLLAATQCHISWPCVSIHLDTILVGEAREGGLRTEPFIQGKQTITEQDKLTHQALVKIKLTISLVFSLIIR